MGPQAPTCLACCQLVQQQQQGERTQQQLQHERQALLDLLALRGSLLSVLLALGLQLATHGGSQACMILQAWLLSWQVRGCTAL